MHQDDTAADVSQRNQRRRERRRRNVVLGLPTDTAVELRRKQSWSTTAYAERVITVSAIKTERGCTDCGYNAHPAALDFDHLPGMVKLKAVGALVRDRAPMAKIYAEIAKCEVVCANCHRIRTHQRRGVFSGYPI